MFEAIIGRAARRAGARVEARRRELQERLEPELPAGVEVEETEQGLALQGRGLARRFALDPRLRWLVAGLVR